MNAGFRPALLLAALSLTVSPVLAADSAPARPVALPGDLGCAMRLLNLAGLVSQAANDPKATDQVRKQAASAFSEAMSSLGYYLGRLSALPNGNRAAEKKAVIAGMSALPPGQLEQEMLACETSARANLNAQLATLQPGG
ncbi:MAG: hypothetical protein ABI673_06990 [Novosphingobium sp.]